MLIFRNGLWDVDGPHMATCDEVLFFMDTVDLVLGWINMTPDKAFSMPLNRRWLRKQLKDWDPHREIFAHVIENEDEPTQLAIGGWVTWGNMLTVGRILQLAPAAAADNTLYGYIQFNRRDGLLYELPLDRVLFQFEPEVFEDMDTEEFSRFRVFNLSKRVLAYHYEDPHQTVLRLGGEE